jgi:hypothetical protein
MGESEELDQTIKTCHECGHRFDWVEHDHCPNCYCDMCMTEVGMSSHYHCANCKEVCSMMGHWNFPGEGYSCEKKPDETE